MWSPSSQQKLWASISRAVRTPARAESDVNIHQLTVLPSAQTFNLPVSVMLNGSSQFQSEVLFAYEMGYRFTFSSKASIDVAAFYNDYSRLRGVQRQPITLQGNFPNNYFEQDVSLINHYSGNTYGFEVSSIWQMFPWFRWDLAYSFLETHYSQGGEYLGTSPQNKASVRAGLNPSQNTTLDLWFRYTGTANVLNTKAQQPTPIPGYLGLDLRLGWKPFNALELSLTGQNLLDDYHLEYLEENYVVPTEIARGVYGKIVWQF